MSDQDRTRLVLIRHGESLAQMQGIASGHDTCEGLSHLGQRQATALHDRLVETGELQDTSALYTSVLPRADQTARIIVPALGENIGPIQECAWCELHLGDAEGLTWAGLRERYPPTGDPDDPFRRRLPNMETWAEFYLRVGTRLRKAADDHAGELVVIAAHGGTIGASFITLGELPMNRAMALTRQARNASITEWQLVGDTWQLDRYNDAAHLQTATLRQTSSHR